MIGAVSRLRHRKNKLSRKGGTAFKQAGEQAVLRLRGGNDIGRAGLEGLTADAHGACEVIDLYVVLLEYVEKMMGARQVIRIAKDISFDGGTLRLPGLRRCKNRADAIAVRCAVPVLL